MMEVVLIDAENTIDHFVSRAKEILESQNEIQIKGKGRETVKAVDVAELLKAQGFKSGNIAIETEEQESEGKKIRTSVIIISMQK